jgi:hypothetical protein
MPTAAPIKLTPTTTAALIRKVLRGAFPACKFSVTTARGSMVSSVNVRWTDGPTVKAVDAIVGCFEDGHFDGMQDMHVYAQGADKFLVVEGTTYERGTRYVHTSRTISPSLANRCIAAIAAYWGDVEVVPVAIATRHGEGFEIADGLGNAAVRADLDRCRHDWYGSIYRASNDRTEFTRQVAG